MYLVSSGKKQKEIDEITAELEDHLLLAEQNGKNINDIIGKSPQQYMEDIASELKVDFKGLSKVIPIIMIGALAYTVMGDAIRGTIDYSAIMLVGFPVVILLLLSIYTGAFRLLAKNEISKTKENLIFFGLGLISISSFVVLSVLDEKIGEPLFTLGTTGHIAVGVAASLVFVALALWSKTWFSIIIPLILFIPEIVVRQLPISDGQKLYIFLPVMFIGLAIYMRWERKKVS
ncbi:HAAS domain-containing protein [Bacillus sp. T33-2]|uniref:HAAS domain-containing protein n=1 Tax=Bacillus sp. T33-2 TaxID=2054168 RepID=UPI000C775386|nr:hypothetical protein [Bacillus sp. T33-2]PLR94152.1 hypothetical protein CVD19_17885 [Bacillus sp. T33-2]